MNRDELLKAVTILCAGGKTDEEDVALANELEQKLPHSDIIDLLFLDMRNLTIEQAVDEALKREAEHSAKAGMRDNNRDR